MSLSRTIIMLTLFTNVKIRMPTSRFVRDRISRKWLKPPVFLSKITIMFICYYLPFNIVCHLVELFKALRLPIMFCFKLPIGIFVWDMEVKNTFAPLYSYRLESQISNYVQAPLPEPQPYQQRTACNIVESVLRNRNLDLPVHLYLPRVVLLLAIFKNLRLSIAAAAPSPMI